MSARGWTLMGALVSTGCFWASEPSPVPTPADRPALETRLRADSADVPAIASLAALRLVEGDPAGARDLLVDANERAPDDPAVPLLLAVAEERLGAYSTARERYRGYREARIGVLAERAGERVPVLDQAALRMEVRADLAGAPPPLDDEQVAILPFAHSAGDDNAEALAAAIAALVSWDVDADRWQAVDPVRLRVVLDELGVEATERADLAVGMDVGRRLGASRIVQANTTRVSLDLVAWEVTVVTVGTDGRLRVEHMVLEGGLSQAVRMQRRLSGMVREALAEQVPTDLMGPVHTRSSSALTAFGRGLLATDRGDFNTAHEAFLAASEADGGFVPAAEHAGRLESVLGVPPLDSLVLQTVRIAELQRTVAALRDAPGSTHRGAAARVGGRERPILSDALGLDVLSGGALLDVTFTAPGSGP